MRFNSSITTTHSKIFQDVIQRHQLCFVNNKVLPKIGYRFNQPQTNTNTIYLVRDETFMLNATGRCTESIVTINNVDTHWIYTYNAKG